MKSDGNFSSKEYQRNYKRNFSCAKNWANSGFDGIKALTSVMPVQHSTNNWEKVIELVLFFI